MNEKERLKRVKEEKRKLHEEQKAILMKLGENKEKRFQARKSRAQYRKEIIEQKKELFNSLSNIVKILRHSEPEELEKIAYTIHDLGLNLSRDMFLFAEQERILRGEDDK